MYAIRSYYGFPPVDERRQLEGAPSVGRGGDRPAMGTAGEHGQTGLLVRPFGGVGDRQVREAQVDVPSYNFV